MLILILQAVVLVEVVVVFIYNWRANHAQRELTDVLIKRIGRLERNERKGDFPNFN